MTTDRRSFLLRYVGARYEGHRLPLDVLPDLSAFRDLIASYAKAQWRAAHKKRERLPKGFEKSIAFNLVGVGDGSAVPTLEWDRATAQLLLPDFKDELEDLVEQSYHRVLALVDGADSRQDAVELSSENIRALNHFGSGLLDDERIEFVGSRGADGNVVYLDLWRRKRLITRGRDSYQTRFESIGRLLGSEIDTTGANGFIIVATTDHGTLRIPMSPERVREDFDGNIEADVQFRLMIELDNNDTFRGVVVDVFDIDVIDGALVANLERCRTRIATLRTLKEGWHDGHGAPVTDEAATAASRLLTARPRLAGSYCIYPAETGGLLIEFVLDGWDYAVEIGPKGSVGIYGVQVDGSGEIDLKEFEAINGNFFGLFDSLTGEPA
jgi:hypothetical protein